jgi:hypothetical protein
MYGVLLLVFCLWSVPTLAQNDAALPEPTQNPNATFRVFRTQNIFTMLKLNTRTGQIWQVQWSLDDNNRFTVPTSQAPLLPPSTDKHPTVLRSGRFTLTPTENIHTFILLDQEDGRTWQVQWGDEGHRMITPIP